MLWKALGLSWKGGFQKAQGWLSLEGMYYLCYPLLRNKLSHLCIHSGRAEQLLCVPSNVLSLTYSKSCTHSGLAFLYPVKTHAILSVVQGEKGSARRIKHSYSAMLSHVE